MPGLFIPSPSISSVQLGPLTIHFYALCIIAGIVVAWTIAGRRWRARGGKTDQLDAVLTWAIPGGVVGARLYHVLSHLPDYIGPGRDPWTMLYIWQGGLGIYGAIAGGVLAAAYACRRHHVRLTSVLDSTAPGIILAQAMGRVGNWFNQELFGRPTTLPWALEISPEHRPRGFEQYATFHPTFLYEVLWNVAVAGVLLWADRRFGLGRGKTFWLYVPLYLLGRIGTEMLRIDPAETILGLRNHQFIAIVLFVIGVAVFVWLCQNRQGREASVMLDSGLAGGEVTLDPTAAGDDTEPDRADAGPADDSPAAEDRNRP